MPIRWGQTYAESQFMHMSQGHNESVWENPRYRASLLGGFRWNLGIEDGDATPNTALFAEQEVKAKAETEAAGK